MLAAEYQAVGFYVSGHPLDDYMPALRRKNVITLAELRRKAEGGPLAAMIAGSVAEVQLRKSARGNRLAFVAFSDPTGMAEVTVFSDVFDQVRDLLVAGQNVIFSVEASQEGDGLRLLARSVSAADRLAAEAVGAGLRIFLSSAPAASQVARILADHGQGEGRRSLVELMLQAPDLEGEVALALPEPQRITPQIRGAIKHVPGVVHIEDF
jgi:DNA polymerase-3 subunit alpha